MQAPLALGLDIGTTSCKLTLIDGKCRVLRTLRSPTPWKLVPTGREMHAEDLFGTVTNLLERLVRDEVFAAGSTALSLGITSMGQTGTFVDPAGHALGPMVSWDDKRSGPAAALLREQIGDECFARISGLPVGASWTACQFRQLWSRRTLPFGAKWLGVADYIAYRLTGVARAELSLACQSGLVDINAKDWSEKLLDWAGVDRSAMPALGTSDVPVGRIAWGPCKGAVVTLAGHDHLAACIGAGADDPETLYDSCGTAETLIRTVHPDGVSHRATEIVAAGLQLGWHSTPGTMVVAGSHRATWALERIRSMLGHPLEVLVEEVEPGAVTVDGVMADRVTISTALCTPGELWNAAQFSVAKETRRMADAMEQFAGPATRTVVAGGWAQHPPFLRARSELFDCTVASSQAEAGAYGAAVIGAAAAVLVQ
ncbi:L-fuculokinase [Devosia sp.]|jgi:sugar (pentulose or hexulose) kinase|uniref:L-fuculokinase n=1 Tax=Devosia sp. TaxID=1871048 RepID=UPI0037C10708